MLRGSTFKQNYSGSYRWFETFGALLKTFPSKPVLDKLSSLLIKTLNGSDDIFSIYCEADKFLTRGQLLGVQGVWRIERRHKGPIIDDAKMAHWNTDSKKCENPRLVGRLSIELNRTHYLFTRQPCNPLRIEVINPYIKLMT